MRPVSISTKDLFLHILYTIGTQIIYLKLEIVFLKH